MHGEQDARAPHVQGDVGAGALTSDADNVCLHQSGDAAGGTQRSADQRDAGAGPGAGGVSQGLRTRQIPSSKCSMRAEARERRGREWGREWPGSRVSTERRRRFGRDRDVRTDST